MARALLLGFLVGFPIAASPGPMFVFVLRHTLARGWRSGLSSGFGIATGDAIYAALAAFGVAAVTNILIAQRRWIGLAGGIALAFIGIRAVLLQKKPLPQAPTLTLPRERGREKLTGISEYGSMAALTLGNPPTILSFTAVFAGLGLRVSPGWQTALALVIGVMLGSAVWWVVVTVIASLIRERLTPRVMRGTAISSGLVLIAFGAVIAVHAL
jgi:threonine/homoserine/homoserine lactone efflux protein